MSSSDERKPYMLFFLEITSDLQLFYDSLFNLTIVIIVEKFFFILKSNLPLR